MFLKGFEKSFGIWNEEPMNVELEFDKSVKDEVLNYHFHPTQKVEELEEGNVSVKFKASGEMAICFELFKWGKSVEIKAPKKLNDFYKGYLKDCLIK